MMLSTSKRLLKCLAAAKYACRRQWKGSVSGPEDLCGAEVKIACLISVEVNVIHGRDGQLVASVGGDVTGGGGNMVKRKSAVFSSKVTAVLLENDSRGVFWVFLGLV